MSYGCGAYGGAPGYSDPGPDDSEVSADDQQPAAPKIQNPAFKSKSSGAWVYWLIFIIAALLLASGVAACVIFSRV
jgi:hypothetical protein